MTKSPLANAALTFLPALRGVRLSAVNAGVRYQGRKDVMLMHFAAGSVMAGVFTKSATRAAPVLRSQEILGFEGNGGIAILANSGNANAFTGQGGEAACATCCDAVAQALGLSKNDVHMASTGVIGEPLPTEPILNAVDGLVAGLDETHWLDAAEAILTTDTVTKGATRSLELDGHPVHITGIAKGSGMIAPNMATMLGFIATDAKISRELLQKALSDATYRSFNAITVDSDTSTSDSVYFGATWQSDMQPMASLHDPRFDAFYEAVQSLMIELAQSIVKDGEGATKFIEIHVSGAQTEESARIVALAIGNSPLVKTAIAGEDPNWGRIVAAIGKAGEPADRDKLSIAFGDIVVAKEGVVSPKYDELMAAKYMKSDQIEIRVDLGVGEGAFTVWSCDLTKRYIEINADYRS